MSEFDPIAHARLILADPTSLETEWLAACDTLGLIPNDGGLRSATWSIVKRAYNDALDAWIGITVGLMICPIALIVMGHPLSSHGILLGVLFAIISELKRDKPYLFGMVGAAILPAAIMGFQVVWVGATLLISFCMTKVFLLTRDQRHSISGRKRRL